MAGWAQRINNHLPPSLRSSVAHAYAVWLKAWRGGRETARYRREALERERWDPEALAAWQRRRLEQVLELAAKRVPYYRGHWESVRGFDTRAWTALDNWPLLPKVVVHRDPETFIADGQRRWRLHRGRTSGTSGTPVTVWRTRSALQRRQALTVARTLDWNGVRPSDPAAMFGGRLVAPVGQAKPPFWVWDALQKFLYMSSFHLKQAHIAAYLEAMRARRVTYVRGYTSSLHSLARLILENGLQDKVPDLRFALTIAEPVYDYQRETISRALGCRVVEHYGSIETVVTASECEHGRLHLWPEVGIVEVLKDTSDEPAELGEVGRLVCTGLLNAAMPLVRYEIGDRGALATDGCPCGRSLPVLKSIEGRLDDVVVLPDGRRLSRFSHVFKGDIPLREAQVVQERLDFVRVFVVPEPEFSPETGQLIKQRMHDRLGDGISVSVEVVSAIPRGPNGKFRGVVSRVVDATRATS